METLFTFWDIEDARLARTLLEAHNILVVLPDEIMVQANWGLIYAMGGIRLQVPADAAERAAEIYDREREPRAADFAPPRCHVCGAEEVEAATLGRSWALALIALLKIPIPYRDGYVCLSCKHTQQGTEKPADHDATASGLGNPYDPPRSTAEPASEDDGSEGSPSS